MSNFKTAEEKARERAANDANEAHAIAHHARSAFTQSHALRLHEKDARAALRRRDWAGVRLHAAAAAVSQARILDAARYVENARARMLARQ